MARRWICPQCDAGVNAPDRPRRDDVRRYCLACSQRTGRLVERECPALDRQRAASRERAAARRSTVAERDRAKALAARSWEGWDLEAEVARLWRLPIVREVDGRRSPPSLTVARRARASYTTGRAWSNRLHLTIGRGDAIQNVLSVLLHEVAHAAAPYGAGHSDDWGSLYLQLARERFGGEHFQFAVPTTRAVRVLTDRIAAGIGEALAKAAS